MSQFQSFEDEIDFVASPKKKGQSWTKSTVLRPFSYSVQLYQRTLSHVTNSIHSTSGFITRRLSNEVLLIRFLTLLAFVLLLFQVGLFFWITSFDDRLQLYQQLMVKAFDRAGQLQAAEKIAQTATNVANSCSETFCNNQLPMSSHETVLDSFQQQQLNSS